MRICPDCSLDASSFSKLIYPKLHILTSVLSMIKLENKYEGCWPCFKKKRNPIYTAYQGISGYTITISSQTTCTLYTCEKIHYWNAIVQALFIKTNFIPAQNVFILVLYKFQSKHIYMWLDRWHIYMCIDNIAYMFLSILPLPTPTHGKFKLINL